MRPPSETHRSPCNAQAIYNLPGYLPSVVVDRLQAIPGVQVWSAQPVVRCSWSAGRVVHKYMQALEGHELTKWKKGSVRLVHDCHPITLPADWEPPGIAGEVWRGETKIKLYPYQREAIRKGVAYGSGLVEAPTGSGKTLMGDLAALALVQQPLWGHSRARPIIVTVCKASARTQQVDEKRDFYGVEPFAVKPRSLVRSRDRWASIDEYLADQDDLPHKQPWIVVSWSGLVALHEQLAALPLGAVVFDEAHYAKSSDRVKFRVYLDDEGDTQFDRREQVNRSAAAAKLAAAVPARFLTTATPTKNRLQDWWGLLNLIERPGYRTGMDFEPYGPTISKFLIHYCNGEAGEWGGIVTRPPHHSNTDELLDRVGPVRSKIPYRVLADVLPPKRRRVLKVAPDAQDKPQAMPRADRAAFKRSLRDLGQITKKSKKGGESTAERTQLTKETVTAWRLAEACDRKRTATTEVVTDIIDNGRGGCSDRSIPRGKVLLFFGLVRSLHAVASGIKRSRPHARVWVAHGEEQVEVLADGSHVQTDIDTVKASYMASETPAVIVGTYQYIGESHNFQDTDAIVVGMLPYTPGEVAQIEGRGARLGQARPMEVIYMEALFTIDSRCRALVIDKLPAVEVLGEGAHGLDGMSRTLQGIEDIEAVLDGFIASCMVDEEVL